MSVIDFTFWLLGLAIKRGFWQQPLLWIFRKYSYLSSHGAATYPDKRVVDGFFQNFFYMKSWSENHIPIRSKWTLWDVIFHENNSICGLFGNEGYTESGLKLINFWPNLVSKGFLAFTTNIRFDLYPLQEFISIILTSSLPFYLRPKN